MTKRNSLNSLLGAMTPAERRAGRYLRDGDGHPPAPPAGDPPADPAPPADPNAPPPADDGTILGGDAPPAGDPPADPPADPDPATQPPEAYELTAPEGLTLDDETLAEADPIFRELGLSNEAAQKLVPVAAKFGERIAAQASQAANQAIMGEVIAQRKAWATEAKADAEIGGANWDQTVELSAKALDALGYAKGSAFRNFLTDSGLGNHPEMIRAFQRIGKMVGEDNEFVVGNPAHQRTDRLTALYPNDVPKGS